MVKDDYSNWETRFERVQKVIEKTVTSELKKQLPDEPLGNTAESIYRLFGSP